MKVSPGPVITKVIEILFAIVIIGVYYGTDTLFKAKEDDSDCNFAGDNFGQFVIISGLILACVMLAVTFFVDKGKAFVMIIAAYNVIWFVFYLTAAILILSYWSGEAQVDEGWYTYCTWNRTDVEMSEGDDPEVKLNDTLDTMRAGGLTVGSFAILEDVLLIANTVFLFMGSKN